MFYLFFCLYFGLGRFEGLFFECFWRVVVGGFGLVFIGGGVDLVRFLDMWYVWGFSLKFFSLFFCGKLVIIILVRIFSLETVFRLVYF